MLLCFRLFAEDMRQTEGKQLYSWLKGDKQSELITAVPISTLQSVT